MAFSFLSFCRHIGLLALILTKACHDSSRLSLIGFFGSEYEVHESHIEIDAAIDDGQRQRIANLEDSFSSPGSMISGARGVKNSVA